MGKRRHYVVGCVCGKPNPVLRRNWSYYTYNYRRHRRKTLEAQKINHCPFVPGRELRADGTCTRYGLCDEDRVRVCGAKPSRNKFSAPYSKKKVSTGKGCPHKHTDTVPTKDRVIIDGEERRVFEVICKECGYTRRIIL